MQIASGLWKPGGWKLKASKTPRHLLKYVNKSGCNFKYLYPYHFNSENLNFKKYKSLKKMMKKRQVGSLLVNKHTNNLELIGFSNPM